MKTTTKTDRAVMERKRKALTDMADNEDWLDGKAAPNDRRGDADRRG